MPEITDTPPLAVQSDLTALRSYLNDQVPKKLENQNLLVATRNLRAFASLNRVWTAGTKDSPKRDLRGLLAIGVLAMAPPEKVGNQATQSQSTTTKRDE